jgi:hypothetical protein
MPSIGAPTEKNPDKVKSDDLITVRRIIYQSIYQAFKHGRLVSDPFMGSYVLGPNLDLVSKVNSAYTNLWAEETQPNQKIGILKAHRNFLRDAIYFLYEANRIHEAQGWFNYLCHQYPNQQILDDRPDLLPKDLTLDEYAVAVTQSDINETSREKVTSALAGLLERAYLKLADGDDDAYVNFKNMTQRVYDNYVGKTSKAKGDVRVKLQPFDELNASVIRLLLDPQKGVPYEARAILRTRLGLERERAPAAPAQAESAPDAGAAAITNAVGTNAAAVAPVN